MISLEKSFLGIEKNLKGDQQSFVDTFSNFLKKAPEFKGVKTTDNKDISEIEKKYQLKRFHLGSNVTYMGLKK